MTDFLKAEEIGLYESMGAKTAVFRCRNSVKGKEDLFYVQSKHFEEISSIYNNQHNDSIEFLKNITELAENRIKRQYSSVKKDKEEPMISPEVSTLEFTDNSKTRPILSCCAYPFSILSGGEIFIDENLWFNDEKFKKLDKEMEKRVKRVQKKYGLRGLLQLQVMNEEKDMARNEFNDMKKTINFRNINSLHYNTLEEPKINEAEYSTWKIADVEKHYFNVSFPLPIFGDNRFLGIFKEEGKDVKYEIEIGGSNPVLSKITKWTDKKIFKSIAEEIEKKMREYGVQSCEFFLQEFLEKSKVKAGDIFISGNIGPHMVTLDDGKKEKRNFLYPKHSYIALTNGSRKILSAIPTEWAIETVLENDGKLKVKKEVSEKVEDKPPYLV